MNEKHSEYSPISLNDKLYVCQGETSFDIYTKSYTKIIRCFRSLRSMRFQQVLCRYCIFSEQYRGLIGIN